MSLDLSKLKTDAATTAHNLEMENLPQHIQSQWSAVDNMMDEYTALLSTEPESPRIGELETSITNGDAAVAALIETYVTEQKAAADEKEGADKAAADKAAADKAAADKAAADEKEGSDKAAADKATADKAAADKAAADKAAADKEIPDYTPGSFLRF